MKSTLEVLPDNKVKISVEVEETELERSIDLAFRKIAREVRLPGFRPGKAPRRVLEAHIGKDTARAQALQDSIPEFLGLAVREHDVDLIATPEVAVTAGESDGDLRFDATCEVRPEVSVEGYATLRVELPSPEVGDEDLEQVVDGERRRVGSLVDADRPAMVGDHVVIDLAGTRDGEPVPGLNTDDWTYEIGRGWVAPGFDDQLVGVRPGDEVRFSAVPNGTEESADFVVKVQRVQTIDIGELTDDWVESNFAEFSTVEEWRESLRERLRAMRLNQLRSAVVDRVTDVLAALVPIDAPESMVSSDLQARVQNTVAQFQQQGIAIDQWLSATGQSTETFVDGLRAQSDKAVKVDLALRAVAAAEDIVVDEVDLEAEYEAIGLRVKEKPDKVRRAYEKNDAVADLTANIRKSKALDWLLHNVTYVNPSGEVLDRDTVLGHSHGEREHDHGGAEQEDAG